MGGGGVNTGHESIYIEILCIPLHVLGTQQPTGSRLLGPRAIHVRLADHLVHLLVRQLLAQVRHHMAQLRGADEAVAVAVEDFEGLDELLLGVRVLHLARHEAQELGEVDGASLRSASRRITLERCFFHPYIGAFPCANQRSSASESHFSTLYTALELQENEASEAPLPSASTSLIMSCSSASVGF